MSPRSDSVATATENASKLGYKHVCVNHTWHLMTIRWSSTHTHWHTFSDTDTHSLTKSSALITCTWHLMTIRWSDPAHTHTLTHIEWHTHSLTKSFYFYSLNSHLSFNTNSSGLWKLQILLNQKHKSQACHKCNVSSTWRDQMSSSDSVATATENASRLGYKHVCVNYLHVASHDYQ